MLSCKNYNTIIFEYGDVINIRCDTHSLNTKELKLQIIFKKYYWHDLKIKKC